MKSHRGWDRIRTSDHLVSSAKLRPLRKNQGIRQLFKESAIRDIVLRYPFNRALFAHSTNLKRFSIFLTD